MILWHIKKALVLKGITIRGEWSHSSIYCSPAGRDYSKKKGYFRDEGEGDYTMYTTKSYQVAR